MPKDFKNKPEKGRNWAFVVYPESLPKNWLEILELSGLKIAISPLHHADLNADETEKKAHYHVIAIWEGPTTYNNVLQLTKKLNGTIPIKLAQVRGYYRYLTHEDNPEKFQYDKKEIRHLNGFNIIEFVELSRMEILRMKMDIYDLIKEVGMNEITTLLDYLRECDKWDWLDIVSSNTIFFNAILKSRRHQNE